MLPSIAWLVQPIGDAVAWMPVLWVAFLASGFLLAGWGAYVMTELARLRKRVHDVESKCAGLEMLERTRERSR